MIEIGYTFDRRIGTMYPIMNHPQTDPRTTSWLLLPLMRGLTLLEPQLLAWLVSVDDGESNMPVNRCNLLHSTIWIPFGIKSRMLAFDIICVAHPYRGKMSVRLQK
jgi:hypothetical protein